MSADRRRGEGAAAPADPPEEGPDSLMSRLDGSSAQEGDTKERPSAAEILGGRGKRRRIAIRVPDDATPPPPPVKRSQPPPAMPASQPPPPAAEAKTEQTTEKAPEKRPSDRPSDKRASEPAGDRRGSEPAGDRRGSEPATKPSGDVATVRITPTRMIGVGAPTASAPPIGSVPPPAPIATRPAGEAPPSTTPAQDLPSNDAGFVPSIVAAAANTASNVSPSQRPPSPSQRPSQPPPRPSSPAARLATPYPMPASFKPPGLPTAESIAAREIVIKPVPVPAGALVSQPVEPVSQPVSTEPSPSPPEVQAQPTPIRAPTVPNLDRAVKEALDLLDREDFETTAIDVAVVHDADAETQPKLPAVAGENGPTSGEESLDDSVVEEVQPEVPTSGKVKVAPTPPPRKASMGGQQTKATSTSGELVQTLPSARVTETQPASAPVTAAASTQPEAGVAKTTNTPPPAASPDATAEIVKKKKRQWFEELFNDDFARTMPRVPAAHLDREVGFIDDSLGCEKGATILDLGCGPGEHAVRLAKRGYEVIGIDLSLAMLARAADEAAALDARINFVQGDMRELTFEESFDGVYCWGTTFGYFDEQKNAEVIGKVHRALRRGGRILLDVVNRDYVMPRQPSMAWFEGEGCVCMDEMYVNAITSRLHVKRTMMMEDGRQREIDYSIRIYSLHELGKLLHESGFRVVEASGDTSTAGVYFGAESPRIIILAEKR